MPGHYCAVKGCNNNSKKVNIENFNPQITFHSFPKNATARKIWQEFCSRGSTWKPTVSARICSVHFTEEDFKMRFKSDLLQAGSMNRRRLSANALPSVQSTSKIGNHTEVCGQILEDIVSGDSNRNEAMEEMTVTDPANSELVNNAVLLETNETFSSLSQKLVDMQQEIIDLKRYNNILLQDKLKNMKYIAQLEKQNKLLKQEIEKEKSLNYMINVGELAKKLAPAVSENQLNLILKRKLKVKWTSEEISKAFTIRYYSKKAYSYLRNEGFPLPSLKTLQFYAAKINMRSGILHDILKLMEIRGRDLSETEKITVLMYDEMKVKALYEYDVHMDDILGPHNYVQAIMARGLYSDWKQVIFIKFDTNMTKTILQQVITDLHQVHYNVVAFVSDCGGANQGVTRDLGINVEKTYFPHPTTAEKIFYFPDGPHILKLIRNWLLDTGFILESGHIITKKPLEDLVQLNTTEVSSIFKLKEKHLTVTGTERQNVRLAAQLLSHTVVVALKRYCRGSAEAEQLSEFIELVNDWFDIMNSRNLNESIKFKRPYFGSIEQNERLDDMFLLFSTMTCRGKKSMQVFQKAVLMSINSLKGLYEEMRTKYNQKFILTHKLNQDPVENLFSQLRTRGGADDHPTPLNTIYRLRMIILGKPAGNVKQNTNIVIQSDDNYISGTVLKRANVIASTDFPTNEEVEVSDRATISSLSSSFASNAMEKHGVEYLTGWIARKYSKQYPYLGQYSYAIQQGYDHDYALPSWISHISYGGLTEPSELFKKEARFLNRRFKSINKNKFRFKTKFVRTMTNMLKNMVDLPQEVTTTFIRQRMLIRIKYLNFKSNSKNIFNKYKKMSKIARN